MRKLDSTMRKIIIDPGSGPKVSSEKNRKYMIQGELSKTLILPGLIFQSGFILLLFTIGIYKLFGTSHAADK